MYRLMKDNPSTLNDAITIALNEETLRKRFDLRTHHRVDAKAACQGQWPQTMTCRPRLNAERWKWKLITVAQNDQTSPDFAQNAGPNTHGPSPVVNGIDKVENKPTTWKPRSAPTCEKCQGRHPTWTCRTFDPKRPNNNTTSPPIQLPKIQTTLVYVTGATCQDIC